MRSSLRRGHSAFRMVAVAGALAAGVACSASSGGGTHAHFKGLVAGQIGGGASAPAQPFNGVVEIDIEGGSATATMTSPSAGTVTMTGSVDNNEQYTAQSQDGWQMSGDVSGSTTSGSMSGPNGSSAEYTAQDESGGQVSLYCGTFSGAASGTWDVVVSASGSVSGAYSGGLSGSGTLTGSANGSSIDMTASSGSAGQATATGSVSGNGQITGMWSATGGGQTVSGTFTGSESACDTGSAGGGSDGGVAPVGDDGGSVTVDAAPVFDAGPPTEAGPSCLPHGAYCSNPSLCCTGQCYTMGSGSSCGGATSYCY